MYFKMLRAQRLKTKSRDFMTSVAIEGGQVKLEEIPNQMEVFGGN